MEEIEDGKVYSTTEYDYDSGKLIAVTEKDIDETTYDRTKYTHNSDGTVAYEKFIIDAATGTESEDGTVGKYTFKDGNLVKDEESYYGSESVSVYEYDTKNSPFKNVLGFNLLLESDAISVNNRLKETRTSGSGTNVYTYVTTHTYKYDANDYPTEVIDTYQSGSSVFTGTTLYAY